MHLRGTQKPRCKWSPAPRRYISARERCTRWIEIAPSPTADATRFTFPERMSPASRTAGKLDSGICGGRPRTHFRGARSGHCNGALAALCDRMRICGSSCLWAGARFNQDSCLCAPRQIVKIEPQHYIHIQRHLFENAFHRGSCQSNRSSCQMIEGYPPDRRRFGVPWSP